MVLQARVLFHVSVSICGLGMLSALLNWSNRGMLALSLAGMACAVAPCVFLAFWLRSHSSQAILRRLSERADGTNRAKGKTRLVQNSNVDLGRTDLVTSGDTLTTQPLKVR